MTDRLDRLGTIGRALVHEVRTERITFMAGTIAYNAFLSLLPLLFVLLSIASVVGGTQLETNLIGLTQVLVTPGAADIFVSELRNASAGASIAGVAALVWGMLRIFRSLDMAFSDIYETGMENTILNQLKDSFVVFGSLAALVIGVVGLESVVSFTEVSGVLAVLQRLFLIGIVACALVPMYYLFPDESGMNVLETVPGVLFTATGLVVLQTVFGLYVTYSDPSADNQLLASVIVLLTWFYFCGLVILLGAAINAVLSNRSEDVNLEPVIGGVPKASGLDVDHHVPEATLERMRQSLNDSQKMRIVIDDGAEDFELPAPDIVVVDSDTSSLPLVNDTANLELRWSQADSESGAE